jgi:iron(III) transport system ATP-binding protein
MAGLEIRGVSHDYGRVRAVDDVSLTVAPGEVCCLLGPSGCGKTTLLRIAAGLETLQSGWVGINAQVVADARRVVPTERRSVGMVFQDYALFPHLSTLDNVTFGLRALARSERRARALEVLTRVGMASFADSYPHTLSGGQQQRVALARALAPAPAVMLLDEPFGGLDRRLREQVREDSLRVLKESGAAILLVTHDPEEAMAMADRIAVMREGRLQQVGTPADIYLRPANAFVAQFLGEVNRFSGVVRDGIVMTPIGAIPAAETIDGTSVEVLVRPEAIRLEGGSSNGAASGGRAVIRRIRLMGATWLVELEADGASRPIQVLLTDTRELSVDDVVRAEVGHAFVYALPS